MKIAKNFKKVVACLLAFAVVFTCIGSALAVSAEAPARIVTNGNGNATDIGIWYTPYNCTEFFAKRFANPDATPVGYRALLPDGSYGIPFAGDMDIVDFYIEQMAKAGIDFVMFDTTNGGLTADLEFGWGDNEYASNRWIVTYTKMFAERLSKWNDTHAWKIRYALSVGTYKKALVNATLVETAEYQAQGVLDAFVNDPVIGDDYYYIQDGEYGVKPLITLFDWTCVAENQTDIMLKMDEEDSALSKFTVRSSSIGQAGTYSWNNNANGGAAVYDEEVVTVCPGHAQQSASVPTDSRRDGKTYEENLAVALGGEGETPRVVMISSFNDYMEQTAVFVTNTDDCKIENAEEKWTSPYQYWDMTVNFIKDIQAKNAALGYTTVSPSTGLENVALAATPSSNSTILWPEGTSGWNNIANINDGLGKGGARALFLAKDNLNKIVNFDLTFDSAKTINNVLVYAVDQEADAYGFKHVAIEVCVDGNWKRVAEVHDITVTNKQVVPFYFAPVKATAVRVSINARGQGNTGTVGLQEIEVYNNPTVTEKDYTGMNAPTDAATGFATIKGANVVVNGSGTGGDWNAHLAGGTPLNITDGKLTGGRTTSQIGSVANPWYEVAIKDGAKFNTVNIVWDTLEAPKQNYSRKDFAVDVKMADGAYVRVAEVHAAEKPVMTSANQYVATEVTFEAVEAVAVRVWFLGSSGELVSLFELEAFMADVDTYTGITAPAEGKTIKGITSSNWAAASTGAVASTSTWSDVSAAKLSRLNDGDAAGPTGTWSGTLMRWSGAASDWYQIDLASPQYINKIYVDFDMAENHQTKDLAVEVQLEDGTWKRVAGIHYEDDAPWAQHWSAYNNKTNRRIFTFASVKAKAFRVYGNYNTRNSIRFSIVEIFAWNDSGVTSYTGIPTGLTKDQQIIINQAVNGTVSDNFPKSWGGDTECLVDGSTTNESRSAHDFGTGVNLYNQILFANGPAVINTVNLVWDTLQAHEGVNYSKKDFAVEVITADGSYYLVAEVHLDEKVAMSAKNEYVNTVITFADVEAKGIRIWFNKGSGGLVSLYEIESYYQDGVTEYTGITKTDVFVTETPEYDPTIVKSGNYAKGQKVTSSNTNWVLFAGNYPADRLTDGVHGQADTGACALANYVNGEASFTVNFDKAYTINKVVTLLSAHEATIRPDEYIIEAKTADGWARVAVLAATQSAGHVSDEFYFEAVECTAVRVIANNKANGAGSPNFRINEIEAYYDSTITADMYTGVESALSTEFAAGKQGDVNNDSWIDAIDLAYALNVYVGAKKVAAGNAGVIDTNRDGKYDIRDYIYLVEQVAIREANLAGLK